MSNIPEDILIPPPSLKQIIHKTISVIRENSKDNGNEFLDKLKSSDNVSFQFIQQSDQYFPYFQYLSDHPEIEVAILGDDDKRRKDQEAEDIVKKEDLQTVEELQFLASNDTIISEKDEKMVKLAALYVSINGTDAINELLAKYGSLKFGFLKEEDNSTYRDLFLHYLTQYKLLQTKSFEYDCNKTQEQLLDAAFQRAKNQQFEKQQLALSKKSDEEEKMKYLRVDWMDFTLVQTVEFTEIDEINELPGPVQLTELKYRTLEQKIKQTVVVNEDATKAVNGIKIKEFNARRKINTTSSSTQIKERQIECPITGKLVAESKFQTHLQILLRDPNYKQIKQNYEEKFKYDNLQGGVDQIVENLKGVVSGVKRRKY